MDIIDYRPETAMVIFAHPDDAEIGSGGTVSKWSKSGTEITFVQCTTGNSGSNDLKMTSERIEILRHKEQKEAANIIGVKNLISLEHEDGKLKASDDFLEQIVENIRKFKPEVVFTHDHFRKNSFQHRDHRNTGITVQDAVYPFARDHLHFENQIKNGLTPHKVKEIFFWGTDEPNIIVDITESINTKIQALSMHRSQIPGLSVGSDLWNTMKKRHEDASIKFEFKYGEVFRRVKARS
ncbi:MAG: GlcNAc-PI de-N-acetylase [Chloroflexi bacterium]|nr:GlcNAc-PI de-N-acetylase [Chloroflexota bacterium]|tara:strand:- start:639 stop:1352 length:714 start_codon:yes stop_codon:yes gene_type:complete